MVFGVFAGATIAYTNSTSNFGKNSEIAGMSGAFGERLRLVMPKGINFPERTYGTAAGVPTNAVSI